MVHFCAFVAASNLIVVMTLKHGCAAVKMLARGKPFFFPFYSQNLLDEVLELCRQRADFEEFVPPAVVVPNQKTSTARADFFDDFQDDFLSFGFDRAAFGRYVWILFIPSLDQVMYPGVPRIRQGRHTLSEQNVVQLGALDDLWIVFFGFCVGTQLQPLLDVSVLDIPGKCEGYMLRRDTVGVECVIEFNRCSCNERYKDGNRQSISAQLESRRIIQIN